MTTTTTPDFTTPQPASSTSPAPENCCEKIIFQSNGGVKDFYHEALGNEQRELFLEIPALFLHTRNSRALKVFVLRVVFKESMTCCTVFRYLSNLECFFSLTKVLTLWKQLIPMDTHYINIKPN